MSEPWVAILLLTARSALCLGLGCERLVALDILTYWMQPAVRGINLVVLLVKEPKAFRIPGGLAGAVFVAYS